MTYLSLFSGIGGFELGIQRACNQSTDEISRQTKLDEDMRQVRQWQTVSTLSRNDSGIRDASKAERNILPPDNGRFGAVCIGYSEIDKYAIKVYERYFKHENYGNATLINTKDLPDFDLLVGGFPCQAFSIAGKRKGFDDTRGTLFFDIARILKDKRPRHLVLENVKGLLSHDTGKTFQTILGVLSDLGYRVEWQVLNSKDFGVPQNRERIFIIGHLRGECRRQVFPIRSTHQPDSEHIQGHVSNALTARYEGAQATGTYIGESELNAQDKHCETCICHITEEVLNPDPEASDDHCETCTCAKILHNIYGGFKEGKARVFKDVSPTIRTSKGGGHLPSVLKNSRIRRLTPKECERLQGFPDDWTAGESDTQRYKMCGNAVTVNVVEAVMKGLLNEKA